MVLMLIIVVIFGIITGFTASSIASKRILEQDNHKLHSKDIAYTHGGIAGAIVTLISIALWFLCEYVDARIHGPAYDVSQLVALGIIRMFGVIILCPLAGISAGFTYSINLRRLLKKTDEKELRHG